jgi:hypothetical protein
LFISLIPYQKFFNPPLIKKLYPTPKIFLFL